MLVLHFLLSGIQTRSANSYGSRTPSPREITGFERIISCTHSWRNRAVSIIHTRFINNAHSIWGSFEKHLGPIPRHCCHSAHCVVHFQSSEHRKWSVSVSTSLPICSVTRNMFALTAIGGYNTASVRFLMLPHRLI